MNINDHENNDILTVKEVANYLKISERSILRMIKNGEIPVTKIASQWRFMKTVIDDWLISKMEINQQSDFNRVSEKTYMKASVSQLITSDLIIPDLKSGDKKTILTQLVEPLVNMRKINDGQKLVHLLMEREKMVSTGLTDGVAIPHVRMPKENLTDEPVIVLGICHEGINYDSLDGKKTYLFFLVCTKSEIMHLKLIAKISVLAKNNELINSIHSIKEKSLIMAKLIKIEKMIDSLKNSK